MCSPTLWPATKDHTQMVIEANLIPPLVQQTKSAELVVVKEAAWALSNATSGGTPTQIKFLVSQGCIRPICDLLTASDAKIVKVALDGLASIMKVGHGGEPRPKTQEWRQRGRRETTFPRHAQQQTTVGGVLPLKLPRRQSRPRAGCAWLWIWPAGVGRRA